MVFPFTTCMTSNHAADPDPVAEKKMDPDRKHQKVILNIFHDKSIRKKRRIERFMTTQT